MAKDEKLYTVKWPRAEGHRTKSVSGVLVEPNLQRQISLHFYNEVREVEEQVQYKEDGQRQNASRELTYVREVADTVLISEETAIHLRNLLNSIFPPQESGEIN